MINNEIGIQKLRMRHDRPCIQRVMDNQLNSSEAKGSSSPINPALSNLYLFISFVSLFFQFLKVIL